ncbi:MAG: CDP-alcohol phosphatidyltransferase [Pseudopedobacter saltans]|uniref:CDP-alcohol phosphatidyltransferase n=1 Tax=Pseudopedobacter saltans TaxID=151895 RepID=A0A2W5F640_9SPHI|nr:MAG: CDP-alcohol phosphatidyltransferase [Pseudopedobacter saltans]
MKIMRLRDKLQLGIYKVIDPFVRFLIKIGFTPNRVTITGFILNVGVAIIFIVGAEKGHRGDFDFVGWAGALTLFAGLFDMLDGQVARIGKMSSTYGALFDSVLDRYSECIMFLGICYYLVGHHYFLSSIFAFVAMIGSVMVSYTRARSEGLGIQNKGGFMQRPERVVLLGISGIVCGVASHFIGDYKLFVPGFRYHIFETMSIFTIPITVMAVMTNITAIGRLMAAKPLLDAKDREKEAQSGKVETVNTIATKTIVMLLLFLSIGLGSFSGIKAQHTIQIEGKAFPIPPSSSKMLFYLQRSSNTNTIICELNGNSEKVDDSKPVVTSWLRYGDDPKGPRKDLNFIQRTFAYGMKSKSLGNGQYSLHFVCYKKYEMRLMKINGLYHITGPVNGKVCILDRMFININGGSFWSPNVEYVEIVGHDMSTSQVVSEKLTNVKKEEA